MNRMFINLQKELTPGVVLTLSWGYMTIKVKQFIGVYLRSRVSFYRTFGPLVLLFTCYFLDTVETLTPQKLRGIRTMLNASAMDVLYYTSPLYRKEVR